MKNNEAFREIGASLSEIQNSVNKSHESITGWCREGYTAYCKLNQHIDSIINEAKRAKSNMKAAYPHYKGK